MDDGGDEIALVFDELIDFSAALNLPVARFSVTVDGSAATFSQFQTPQGLVDFTQVNLDEFDPNIRSGQTVIVTYTDPAGDDVSPMAFQDLAGNDVASFTTGAGGVPAVINNLPPPPPDVTSVEFTSTPPNPAYAIGGVVETTVNFSAAVDITGTPQLELDFAGIPKAVDCVADTNTTWMGCYYEVVAGDSAPNGVAIAADKLTLNGGTITATGSTTITADLDHAAVAIDAGHKVDGIRPTLVTTGSDAPTTSADGTQVILTFSEDISAVSLSGIDLNVNSNSNYEQGATVSRSGRTVTLTLILTIQAGWPVTVELSADAVDDAAGNGNLVLGATTVTNAVGTMAVTPTVTGVALTSAPGSDNTYGIGDAVEATVTFSAAVDISGTPQLELDVAGTAKAAACTAATNTTTTACEYEVVAGDSAPNGIAIGANTLTGGTIYATGSTTITADLDHAAVAIDAGHKVDGIRPTLVTTGSEAPRTSTDGTQVILTFSEDVVSPDRGVMTIRAGGNVVSTSAASANGPRVDLTLTTALTSSTVVVTVALSVDAVLDTANNGNLAVSATVVTNAVDTSDPPGTLKARRGDGEVHLEWVPVAAVPTDPDLAYQLRYGADGGESNQWRDIPGSAPGGPNARSYTVTGLENGTRYAFKLRVRRDSGFGTAAGIRQTPEVPRWSVSTNRRSVHEGEDVTLSIATRNAVGFYSAPEALTLAVIGQIVLEFTTITGADPEDFEIRVDGHKVQGYTKDITFLNFDSDPDRDPFPAQHFDVEVPVGSTSLDVTVTVLADDEEDGQEHMSFMVFRGEELVNEDTWDGTGVNIESGDAGVVKQLAVADAEATEGEDLSLDFVVTLAPAAAWTVTVDYATHDGTARAGSDYTDTSGALTFAPGETEKTVSVPVIDDTVQDTPETLTVRLSNANPPYTGEGKWGSREAGVLIADAVATGTIRNTEDGDGTALTAHFEDVPSSHDGSSTFEFGLVFSEGPEVSYRTLRDSAFDVDNGDVREARRKTQGSNLEWRIKVEPDGDDAVTITLPATSDCGATGAICTSGGKRLENSPSATVAGPEEVPVATNTPAAGAPAIGGTAQVGETLTASVSDISDVDGLDDASFAYQWIRGSADIQGATNASYTLVSADEGETITVRVTFSDDEGHEENLTSAATDTVAAAPEPLTATFADVPSEHAGEGETFTFGLTFSEAFGLSYLTLRDEAFSVSGGTVRRAKRKQQGSNQSWTIHVEPASHGPVTVRLPAGSVETADGRALSHSLSATVAGPVGISVDDARVEEDDGAVLSFAVTLSRAASGALTVDYATSDGSAQAGADYTAASGTLTFQAGESSRTIEVTVLDDSHDDDGETLTLTLSNPSSGRLTDAEATGTIENRDPLPRALLARFGRTAAVHVVEHVEERLAAPREPGFRGRFAGRELRRGMARELALGFLNQLGTMAGAYPAGGTRDALSGSGALGMPGLSGAAPATGGMGSPMGGMGVRMGGAAGPAGSMGAPMGGAAGPTGMAGPGPMAAAAGSDGGVFTGGGLRRMGLGGGDLLTGSSFAMNRESHGGLLSFWSRGAQSRFAGREGTLGLGGDVRTTMVGADYARGPLVAGLSLSHSRGLGEYTGVAGGHVASSVTGLYPWLGYQATDRVTVWGVAGYGAGGLRLTPDRGPALEAGLSMAMAAAGTRGELVAGGAGGFALAFKADALWVGTATDGVDGAAGRLAATEAAVTRVRTGLEGSRAYTLAGRLSLRPSVEVGLRHDGGDAETGAGMDVGAGLVVSDASTGLAVDVWVRTLLVHQADGFSERGVALSLSYNPTPSSPLGFTAKVAPSWGGEATSGAEALWGRETMGGMAHGGLAQGNRLDAEMSYGLPVGRRFVGTPRFGVGTSAYGRDYRVGYGLGVLDRESLHVELGVDAQRRESLRQDAASTGVLGRATVRW